MTTSDDRLRAATTRLVTAALLLGLLCFVAAIARGLPAGGAVVTLGGLPAALARLDPSALVSVGVLLLLLAPLARVVGLGAQLWQAHDRLPAAACFVTLALLALSFLLAR